jgi:hypothetical protein
MLAIILFALGLHRFMLRFGRALQRRAMPRGS